MLSHSTGGFPIVGLNKVGISYPFKSNIEFFEDFLYLGEVDFASGNHKARWKVAGTNADPTANVTRAATPTSIGGVMNFTTTTSSGDEFYTQPGTNSGMFMFESSTSDPRPLVFQARICQSTTVANGTFGVGLCIGSGITSTTDPVGTQCEGIYFVVDAGTVKTAYKTSATTGAFTAASYLDVTPNVAVSTLVVSVMHTYTILYDGQGQFWMFFDGRLVKNVVLPSFTARSINPFFGVTANTAAAAAVNIDYIYASQECTRVGGGRL